MKKIVLFFLFFMVFGISLAWAQNCSVPDCTDNFLVISENDPEDVEEFGAKDRNCICGAVELYYNGELIWSKEQGFLNPELDALKEWLRTTPDPNTLLDWSRAYGDWIEAVPPGD